MPETTAADWAAKPRKNEAATLTDVEVRDNYVHFTYGGWSFTSPREEFVRIPVAGRSYRIETIGFALLVGIADDAGWLYHRSNQELADKHNTSVRDFEDHKRRLLEEHREEWAAQEAQLPDWLRERLERFRANGGEHFELDGWGYELAVCRLAEAYASGDEKRADELDEEMGCSGNQHGFAQLLVRTRDAAPERLAEMPSALTPLTGDPYYLQG